ncbi:MAG TPA: NAD-dependent succinate-semialdehyde dehydrogenase [Caldilineaceae bacterium]|nr:NAD-dependent succinate-semialdehyde dehydrogenase [Caldilineaceae bacterium]
MPYQLYINGAWRDGRQGKTIEIEDPATGEFFATSAYGDVEDAVDAMDAAAAAFPGWKNKTAYERGALMDKAAMLIRERAKEIAHVLTRENGKPFSESMTETIGCAMWFEWFAEEGKRVYGRMIPSHFSHKRHWVIQQPVGVVVAVNPWNFPINLMCRKLAGALAAGCTIVSRPASQTPLSSMLLYECLHDAGFPPGVVNLVTGSAAKVTTAMLEHPACRKLTFTGSTATGKQLMQQAGARITKLSLELGGHAPLLVFPDVKLKPAVEQTVIGKFRNGGQSCIAPTRIYVHQDIFEDFTDAVVERVASMKVGNGLEEGVEMGPLFDKNQLESVAAFVDDAVAKGAKVLTGGKRLTGDGFDKGYFYAPTVLINIQPNMRLTCEEVFGPVLPLIPFQDEAEAIAAANNTEYGLAGYVLTNDFSTAIRVSEALEYGIIGLNDTVPTVPQAPFGGWKESGINREGGYEGIQSYMETKYISVGV